MKTILHLYKVRQRTKNYKNKNYRLISLMNIDAKILNTGKLNSRSYNKDPSV